MKRWFAAAAVVSTLLALPPPGLTQVLDVWVGGGRLAGDTTYAIGGEIETGSARSGPISELTWPLDVWMGSVGAEAGFRQFTISGEVFTNLTLDAGAMEDSDWGAFFIVSGRNPFFSPDSKDVFSTSEAGLRALILDLRARYWFYQGAGMTLAAGVGWRYQHFDFEAGNLDQYSPTAVDMYGLPFDPFAAMVPGLVITYETTYNIPYLELAAGFNLAENLTVEAYAGYSPIVNVEDRDDHILRFKLSEGDADGTAIMVGLEGQFDIAEHWFAVAGFNYTSIDTHGRQAQRFYDGPAVGTAFWIDEKITSSQMYVFIKGGYAF